MSADESEAPPTEPAGADIRKGGRAKLAENFLDALAADWSKHGVKTIETVRTDKPEQYLRLFAAVLPLQSEDNHEDEISYDKIRELRARLG